MVINDFVLSFVVDHPRLPDFSYIFLQSQVQPNLACFWPGCKACFDQDKPFECVKLNDGFDARWITTLNDIFKGEVGETRIPMPLISENTCFCAKHGNKMRKKYNTDSRADSPHAAAKLHNKIGGFAGKGKSGEPNFFDVQMNMMVPSEFGAMKSKFWKLAYFVLNEILHHESFCVPMSELVDKYAIGLETNEDNVPSLSTRKDHIKLVTRALCKHLSDMLLLSTDPHASIMRSSVSSSAKIGYDIDKVAVCLWEYHTARAMWNKNTAPPAVTDGQDLVKMSIEFMKNCHKDKRAKFGKLPIHECGDLVPELFLNYVDSVMRPYADADMLAAEEAEKKEAEAAAAAAAAMIASEKTATAAVVSNAAAAALGISATSTTSSAPAPLPTAPAAAMSAASAVVPPPPTPPGLLPLGRAPPVVPPVDALPTTGNYDFDELLNLLDMFGGNTRRQGYVTEYQQIQTVRTSLDMHSAIRSLHFRLHKDVEAMREIRHGALDATNTGDMAVDDIHPSANEVEEDVVMCVTQRIRVEHLPDDIRALTLALFDDVEAEDTTNIPQMFTALPKEQSYTSTLTMGSAQVQNYQKSMKATKSFRTRVIAVSVHILSLIGHMMDHSFHSPNAHAEGTVLMRAPTRAKMSMCEEMGIGTSQGSQIKYDERLAKTLRTPTVWENHPLIHEKKDLWNRFVRNNPDSLTDLSGYVPLLIHIFDNLDEKLMSELRDRLGSSHWILNLLASVTVPISSEMAKANNLRHMDDVFPLRFVADVVSPVLVKNAADVASDEPTVANAPGNPGTANKYPLSDMLKEWMGDFDALKKSDEYREYLHRVIDHILSDEAKRDSHGNTGDGSFGPTAFEHAVRFDQELFDIMRKKGKHPNVVGQDGFVIVMSLEDRSTKDTGDIKAHLEYVMNALPTVTKRGMICVGDEEVWWRMMCVISDPRNLYALGWCMPSIGIWHTNKSFLACNDGQFGESLFAATKSVIQVGLIAFCHLLLMITSHCVFILCCCQPYRSVLCTTQRRMMHFNWHGVFKP